MTLKFSPERQKLAQMQSLSLDEKIVATKRRIREWYEHFEGQVYVSFSGGADSTVLLDLVMQDYPKVPAVFCNTGMEYPEIVRFVKTFENVTILRPKMTFKEVTEIYGYPVISKETAQKIHEIRTSNSVYLRNLRLYGTSPKLQKGKLSEKWKYLLDAPFKISSHCCHVMKKSPLAQYNKQTGRKAFVGVMAEESDLRTQSYVRFSCNGFKMREPQSRPMMFWGKQDTLEYIRRTNLKICSVYGDVRRRPDGLWEFSGCQRTGCVFCLFGCHMEKGLNRIQRLKHTHPQMWKFGLNDLGLQKVMDYIGLPYDDESEFELFPHTENE